MAFVRSPLRTGSGPAPTPVAVPEFVVEYEDIAIDSSTKTWAVVHPGLYFLEVIGTNQNTSLSISSSNSPYFDHTLRPYPEVRYMVVDLNVGDTVTYSGEDSHSLFHAIRFTNCSFDSIVAESGVQDNWTEYDAPSADGAYFMYGSCCGKYGDTQKDESVASGDCNIYSVATSNDCAMAHIIACTNQSSSATIKMYGYNYGGSSVVCLKMANVSPAPTPTTYESGVLSIAGSPATLSFDTSSDNHIIVDYEIPYNLTNMSVCGTSSGSAHDMHITTWGDALYLGTGSGEYVVGTGSSYTEGRHTFEFNRNGYIYFDDVQGYAITPTNYTITIGGKGGYNLYGLIYSVEIKSNSTGDTLMKLVPDKQNGVVGFTDEISSTFYPYGHKLVYSEIDT